MQRTRKTIVFIVASLLTLGVIQHSSAQSRKDVFQPGEELIYKVKYGFVKLGTVVIQTGGISADGRVSARLKFWTADVPFLDTKSTITDVIDTKGLFLTQFNEKSQNGDRLTNKQMTYDASAKSLTYSDDHVTNEVTRNIEPFSDALTLVFNMRAWSGAAGKSYSFQMRGKDGQRPVKVNFTNEFSNEAVPALDDKEVRTRILRGQADMGASSPLGANGAFTAYVSDDAAAIPVRIDMSIAVGSITLVLDKVKRNDWTAAK